MFGGKSSCSSRKNGFLRYRCVCWEGSKSNDGGATALRTEWQGNDILIPGALLKTILCSPRLIFFSSHCLRFVTLPFIVFSDVLCNLSPQNFLYYTTTFCWSRARAEQVTKFYASMSVIASEGLDLS